MRRYDVWFLVLAAACLIVGVAMGIVMGVAHDFRLSPVHGHLNLLGWTSLALFGLAYRVYPSLARSRLAALHLGTAAVGAVGLPAGIAASVLYGHPALAIAASFVWLAAALLFLGNLLASLVFTRSITFVTAKGAAA